MNRDLDELMKCIGYQFKDKELLRHALTHSSYANEKNLKPFSDNERLEFLGDAVLEVVSSDFLYKNYPQMHEGDLSKLRASLVCEPTLAFCAKEINLGDFIRLGRGEDATGGRKRKSVTSDAFEAVIGAMYLDGGMEPASTFIRRFVLTDIQDLITQKYILLLQKSGRRSSARETAARKSMPNRKQHLMP